VRFRHHVLLLFAALAFVRIRFARMRFRYREVRGTPYV